MKCSDWFQSVRVCARIYVRMLTLSALASTLFAAKTRSWMCRGPSCSTFTCVFCSLETFFIICRARRLPREAELVSQNQDNLTTLTVSATVSILSGRVQKFLLLVRMPRILQSRVHLRRNFVRAKCEIKIAVGAGGLKCGMLWVHKV